MPVGSTRNKERREQLVTDQNDRKLHFVENTAVTNTSRSDAADRQKREAAQAKLKEMYGDASAQGDASKKNQSGHNNY